jgi:hypothetical protein
MKLKEGPASSFDQIRLLSVLSKELCRQYKRRNKKELIVTDRSMNAIVDAVNSIITELERPMVPAVTGSGIDAWLASDDVGSSSNWMAVVMTGRASRLGREYSYPHDADDFGRCYRFEKAVGPFDSRQWGKLADSGVEWSRIVASWPTLVQLLLSDNAKLTRVVQELVRVKETRRT